MSEEAKKLPETIEEIDAAVKQDDVVLFMKGSKNFPMCGFSGATVAVLKELNLEFADYNILESEELRQNVRTYGDWPTFPQLYIKGELIGGCDIIREMYAEGELQQLLKEKGLTA